MVFQISKTSTLIVLVSSICGCTPQVISGWSYRNGPDPSMPYETRVKPYVSNQAAIMDAFRTNVIRSGVSNDDSRIWYFTAIEGFNFIDAECDQYMGELYALDHARDRFKSGVDSTGLLVNAIMATDPSSKVAMAIVTQAFGLASKYVDTFANSYLYSGHSSTVHHVVEEMQAAYRSEVTAAAITSGPEAYHSIRGYLELCLPPTIEAKIDGALSASKATTKTRRKNTKNPAAAPLVTLSAAPATQ